MTGALFLAAMFVAPLASIVPTEVAAAALVTVGAMMMSHLRHIDISEFSVALPVVLTVATMPFSYSIANGIASASSRGSSCVRQRESHARSARFSGSSRWASSSISRGVGSNR